MNKLSIVGGMGQLTIHGNSRGVDLVNLAGMCATEIRLCLIIYPEIYSDLYANDKNPYFIQTDTVSL